MTEQQIQSKIIKELEGQSQQANMQNQQQMQAQQLQRR